MSKQNTHIELSIELSKKLSKIGADINVIYRINNLDTDNDDIGIYSEEIRAVLDGKKLDADRIEIYYEDGKIDTLFYIVYLFDPTLIPNKKRKSENKIGDWWYILFSTENFDAEIVNELGNNTATVDINSLLTYEYIKYQNTKLSEFLKTQKADYIRSPFKSVTPLDHRCHWQT